MVLIFFPGAYYYTAGKNAIAELGLYSRGLKRDTTKTLALFLVLLPASLALSAGMAYLHLNDLGRVATEVSRVGREFPLFLYYLLSVRVVAEEVFFRGFLAKKFGSLASTTAFAAAHAFYGSFSEVLGAFVLGYLLAEAYRANKNLIPNIFAHAGYNLVILKLLFGF